MSRKPFDKFINKVESGAKKKERIRQEKKKLRAEKNAYFDEQKKLARERRAGGRAQGAGNKVQGTGYREEGGGSGKQYSAHKRDGTGYKVQGTGEKAEGRGQKTENRGERKEERGQREENRGKRTGSAGRSSGTQYSADKRDGTGYRSQGGEKTGGKVQGTGNNLQGTSYKVKGRGNKVQGRGEKAEGTGMERAGSKQQTPGKSQTSPQGRISNPTSQISNPEMPLNKFIAWSGVCGRREAADLIKAGKVIVNNQVIKEPPFRVTQSDSIKVNGKKISIQKNLVYILLNKPKDYITTTDDPEGRKTVMDLVKRATEERVFPVGRLDRNTTGVLLLTNDGELAQRLTHPKYQVKKIYEVRVDKPVTKQQLDKIASGITLEDGFIQPDAIAYADANDKSIVGIEIHSGRNRIVRRIFEHLGFKVKNLDRVMYGIFTKKNVERGKWRLLTEKEIRLLKHLNTSFANKKSS